MIVLPIFAAFIYRMKVEEQALHAALGEALSGLIFFGQNGSCPSALKVKGEEQKMLDQTMNALVNLRVAERALRVDVLTDFRNHAERFLPY